MEMHKIQRRKVSETANVDWQTHKACQSLIYYYQGIASLCHPSVIYAVSLGHIFFIPQ